MTAEGRSGEDCRKLPATIRPLPLPSVPSVIVSERSIAAGSTRNWAFASSALEASTS